MLINDTFPRFTKTVELKTDAGIENKRGTDFHTGLTYVTMYDIDPG